LWIISTSLSTDGGVYSMVIYCLIYVSVDFEGGENIYFNIPYRKVRGYWPGLFIIRDRVIHIIILKEILDDL